MTAAAAAAASTPSPSSSPQALYPTIVDYYHRSMHPTSIRSPSETPAGWQSRYSNDDHHPGASAGSTFWMPDNSHQTAKPQSDHNEQEAMPLDLFTYNNMPHEQQGQHHPAYVVPEAEQARQPYDLYRTVFQVDDTSGQEATAAAPTDWNNTDPHTPSSTTSLAATATPNAVSEWATSGSHHQQQRPRAASTCDDPYGGGGDDHSVCDSNSSMMTTLHHQQHNPNDRSYLLCSKLMVATSGNGQQAPPNDRYHDSFVSAAPSQHTASALSPPPSTPWWPSEPSTSLYPLSPHPPAHQNQHPLPPAPAPAPLSDPNLLLLDGLFQPGNDPFPPTPIDTDVHHHLPRSGEPQSGEPSSLMVAERGGGGHPQVELTDVEPNTVAQWLRSHLQRYLLAPNPVAMGERTIVILTGKVAQKSYGTEKRFLCPSPTVILDGSSWWSSDVAHDGGSIALPPVVKVTMSTETSEAQQGQADWYSLSGALVGQTGFPPQPPTTLLQHGRGRGAGRVRASFERNNSSTITTTERDWYRIPQRESLAGGKCVLRQLYVNDVAEANRRKQVECLAHIHLADGSTVGTLASRPIKVISKPSKKRHSMANMDSCIHHGSLVALFNRVRSQTVSTRYLGVSAGGGAAFLYPGQCRDGVHLSGKDTCFTARTGSWEPFVIWLVDRHFKPSSHTPTNEEGTADEYIGASCASTLRAGVPYPRPPAVALKNRSHQPLAIHYNQHVVLQCLTTGLVSPVMIIRKVDRPSAVVFGGANVRHCYPHTSTQDTGLYGGEFGDEVIGDPVSQLHRVAFQIVNEQSLGACADPGEVGPLPRCSGPATYLACLNDRVGMHHTSFSRRLSVNTSSPRHVDSRASARRRVASVSSTSASTSSHPSPLLLPRQPSEKRSWSISAGETTTRFFSTTPTPPSAATGVIDPSSWTELGSYWSEQVADSSVWTIVGTECAKYTIWQPPGTPAPAMSPGNAPTNQTIPCLFGYTRSAHARSTRRWQPQNDGPETVYLALRGVHFSSELDVWFGDVRSPHCEYISSEQMICKAPPQAALAHAVGAAWKGDRVCTTPLLLARRDGSAVYRTDTWYTFSF